ncbi:hypothetical protein ASE00_11180 [Sphingomonas sp. Root710]|uniref:5-formyltetrahydrofolate cyclo-ligase n=1 Tax=Sphingomonas sp. Root710 TaxID=1736594 RepID=UPI0006F7FD61|nr:5-formyltetrahydrofolate cyclo-ligase [Sphingomonas sp. Root710]KRB82596.1 hypothetical protein ASE00_11180 [Sphingomonas sp. Root710]
MSDPAKAALRAELRAARDAFILGLAPGERGRLEAGAAAHLAPLLDGASCIAFYHALGSELDCGAAITAAAARGATIALPHVEDRQSPMRFLAWMPGDPLETGWRGLIQPRGDATEVYPDAVVAPLLGFDSTLARLGQGAGFYDRAFAAHPEVKKIGLCWSIQRRPVIACDPWDVPLDAVVTEAGVSEGTRPR